MYNIDTPAKKLIKELVDISEALTAFGIKYEAQRLIFDLAEKVYVEDILPKIKK